MCRPGWLVGTVVLAWFLMVASGCGHKAGQQARGSTGSSPIEIEAFAFRETPGLDAPIDYPDYTVLLRLSNRGDRSFVFDKMKVTWDPGNGKALTGTSTPGESNGLFQIEPGQTEEYWETSAGRTAFLLHDAGDKPLYFQVELQRDGKPVLGPARAPLPDLASLSDVHKDKMGQPLSLVESASR